MTEVSALRPVLAVLLPAIAVLAIIASNRHPALRDSWTLLAALGQVLIVASLVRGIFKNTIYVTTLGDLAPGVAFALRADSLGVLFAIVASALWLVTSIYNIGYTRRHQEHAQTRYFASFAATLAAAVGVAFAANLLTLFVFYELLTVATYPLVTHRETDLARRAGRKYVLYTFGGGVLVFAGIIIVFVHTGTTAFTTGGIASLANADPAFAKLAFGLLIAGFGVKAALMPLHSWLPAAMVAPTPVSGLLHAVAVVKSGVFAIARVVLDVYGLETMHALELGLPLAVVAAVTTLTASLFALKQTNLKRLLAYSTVSQLAYIVLGLAVLHPTALFGGLFHIPAHAVMKLALFLCAGIISVELHLENIDDMAGLGRRLPATMTAFTIACMGMIGIPLTAGFVTKLYLVIGSFDAGVGLFASVLAVNSVLKIAYFWPIVYQAFFETPTAHDPKPILMHPIGGHWAENTDYRADGGEATDPDHDQHDYVMAARSWRNETSWFLLGPVLLLALAALLLGIVPEALYVSQVIQLVVELTAGGVF